MSAAVTSKEQQVHAGSERQPSSAAAQSEHLVLGAGLGLKLALPAAEWVNTFQREWDVTESAQGRM